MFINTCAASDLIPFAPSSLTQLAPGAYIDPHGRSSSLADSYQAWPGGADGVTPSRNPEIALASNLWGKTGRTREREGRGEVGLFYWKRNEKIHKLGLACYYHVALEMIIRRAFSRHIELSLRAFASYDLTQDRRDVRPQAGGAPSCTATRRASRKKAPRLSLASRRRPRA